MPPPAQSSSDEIGLEIPGYKFWIEIDGKRAKQYQIEHDNDVVSCYIASEVDKEFTIVIQKHQHEALSIDYYLHDDLIEQKLLKPERQGDCRLSDTRTERGLQKFAFSNINYADDEQMGLSSVPQNLGTIRLMLYHVWKFGNRRLHERNIFDLKAVSTMSEKTKSIGFHSISLRPPEHPKPTDYYTVHRLNPSKPWYTIKFVYRPLDILQAQGIAPEFNAQSNLEDVPNDPQDDQNLEKPSVLPKTESTEERKPLMKSNKVTQKVYRTEKSKVVKTIETIVIEDSDSEDDGPSKVKIEKKTGSKRPRTSCAESVHQKRRTMIPKPDPDIIILDSD